MATPSATYIAVCQRYARWLAGERAAEPGDWIVPLRGAPEQARLVVAPIVVAASEVVVPRLERLLTELARECSSFVLDFSSGEFACVAFDEQGRTLANVVASDPAAAAAQALAFIRAERAASVAEKGRTDEP